MNQNKYTVLVVDDELSVRNALKRIIDKIGFNTILADSGEAALDSLRIHNPNIVYLDLRLPGMNGLEVLKGIKAFDSDIVVFLISAYGTFKDVVEAIQTGAFDYIQKPFSSESIKISLLKAAEAIRSKREVRQLQYKSNRGDRISFRAKSAEMCKILELAKDVAKSSDTSILIQGETGVGKEIVAQIIHYYSPRCKGPFLCLNCGAFPKELLESELFGYNKGAFTGADKSKPGLFELADDGTLLLDEIGDLSLEGQVKLLRVLENGTFFRVGGTAQKHCDVRILASTNRDLEQEIKKGNFREDLYYRLNVVKIRVPPLRERKSDIIPLAEYFIVEFNKKLKKNIKGFAPEVFELLFQQEWKGNVRELRNAIERAVLLENSNIITMDSISITNNLLYTSQSQLHSESMNLHDNVRKLIQRALLMSSGNQIKAAQILGIARGTLRYKLKKYHIECDSLLNEI